MPPTPANLNISKHSLASNRCSSPKPKDAQKLSLRKALQTTSYPFPTEPTTHTRIIFFGRRYVGMLATGNIKCTSDICLQSTLQRQVAQSSQDEVQRLGMTELNSDIKSQIIRCKKIEKAIKYKQNTNIYKYIMVHGL